MLDDQLLMVVGSICQVGKRGSRLEYNVLVRGLHTFDKFNKYLGDFAKDHGNPFLVFCEIAKDIKALFLDVWFGVAKKTGIIMFLLKLRISR